MYVAKLSLSHRSSHQRIVTRFPNHMCASSCRNFSARSRCSFSVDLSRKRYASVYVTQQTFSMAPELYSGRNTWADLENGYGWGGAGSAESRAQARARPPGQSRRAPAAPAPPPPPPRREGMGGQNNGRAGLVV